MQRKNLQRGAVASGLLLLTLAALTPTSAAARPELGAKRGFRLFARPLGAMTINRVLCGLASTGQICVDSTNSSTIGGGFWPKGTANQYVFQMGVQIAGIIGDDGGPWAGDTTGAFFVDTKGTTEHGREVRPIYNSVDPADAADWPDAARVPGGQSNGDTIYNSLLHNRIAASQGDIWFITWDGDPALNAGRPHPLGVMAETRGMGWNFPKGNEDILYFVVTFYNITSSDPASYSAIRPAMAAIALEQGQQFQALNNAAFGITLPTGGYTITEAYPAYITDMDVAQAGINFASVNLPFALGDTYEESFGRTDGWKFDPSIFSAPFFAGSGFVGVKYLKSPTGPGEIQLYSNTINGGAFGDAQNTTQLWRYLSGNISVAAGDAPCNTGNPAVTHVCFINNTAANDMRFFQSSTALELAPGGFVSLVTAGIFAAPVSDPACAPPCPASTIIPGDVTIMGDAAKMSAGVPPQQRMAGYIGFNDINTDGVVTQDEFVVVPGSLLGKALTAQAVFDNGFLLPFAPEAPEFFMVPGDNQVTVLWQPSPSEATGDPFFDIASQAQIGGSVNALYDPNYRQFDVEGYRVYRGRVDAPNELTLLAQFDYAGTVMNDFGGQVNPDPLCAPELGVVTNCAVPYNPAEFVPGMTRTVSEAKDLTGDIEQVKLGERTLLSDGTAFVLVSDTAVVGDAASCLPNLCPDLANTGVPFVFVDNTVRNDFRYFYAVTAFDVNSWQSGPTNLESPRITQPIVPRAPASNYQNTATISAELFGRDLTTPLDINAALPTIDPVSGTFSGPMPPSDAWVLGFQDFVQSLIAAPGQFSMKLDSVQLGDAYNNIFNGAFDPGIYWFTATTDNGSTTIALPLAQNHTVNADTASSETFVAAQVDGSLAARYGGDASYPLFGQMTMFTNGPYLTNGTGRGAAGFGNEGPVSFSGQIYDGARWFSGDNETAAHPTAGNCVPNCVMTNFNNAGTLDNVITVHQPQSYTTMNFSWRGVQGMMAAASRAADIKVYWGANGAVDSVVDVTHDVLVPFQAHMGASWGFLNFSSQTAAGSHDGNPALLTAADIGCVEPALSKGGFAGTGPDCTGTTPFLLSNTAELGAMGLFTTSVDESQTTTAQPNPGFGMYLAGNIFMFEMTALPPAGEVWTLRDYIGGVLGGQGAGGDLGNYSFAPGHRTLSAAGVTAIVAYDVVNQVNRASVENLDQVHPVPDPYYITSEFDTGPDNSVIKFVNLPQKAIVRIYSASGVLVTLLEHNSDQFGGSLDWNVRNRNNQVVASGVYFYHIESGDARRVGRMTIVRFAQ